MEGIVVRQAVLADLDRLVPLFDNYRQFYERESDFSAAQAFLQARFEHGESVIFIAEDGSGKSLGFTQLYPSFSSTSLKRVFILNDLYVAEAARCNGVGALLLSAARDYAAVMDAGRLTLSTAVTNKTAQALYEKEGWKRDEQFYVYHFMR